MKKILIAPNSFKGSANSVTAAEYFYGYLTEMGREIDCTVLPISDGGDGFLEVCTNLFDLEKRIYQITTPFDNSLMEVAVGYDLKNSVVYIESAKVLGLSVIPKEKQKVIELSSKGLGELFLQLTNDNNSGELAINKVIIGIGGTGTNDLGLGMCSISGLKLLDHYDQTLNIVPGEFYKAAKIIWAPDQLPFEIECIVDVQNELLGKDGATYTFASQKGATKGELAVMELGFSKILNLIYNNKLMDRSEKLSGAGGGIPAGLQIFRNAVIIPSKDFITGHLFSSLINQKFDVVITGEGSYDAQSEMGKGAYIVIDQFRNQADKIFLCSGSISQAALSNLPSNVYPVHLKDFFNSEEESIKNLKTGIKKAVQIILKEINS